ncbi:MAG: ATPase [Planctomycetota bacterium]|nr:MAG: ATPase [Planctomycetota bacterium]
MHNRVHVMVDIETLGTGSNAAIVSIGACLFTLGNGPDGLNTFYQRVDLRSCLDAGMDVDARTVLWWLERSPEALLELTEMDSRMDVRSALLAFKEWLPDDYCVYSNGPSFDAKILSTAMEKMDIEPVKFCRERDHRTAIDFLGDRCGKSPKEARRFLKGEQGQTPHHALDDAIKQAMGQHLLFLETDPAVHPQKA